MCNIKDYEFYKSHHICVRCGQEIAEENHTLCLVCMIKSREEARAYHKKHKEEKREQNRIRSRNRYHKLKGLGVCTSCGKRQVKNNKVLCEHCRIKANYKQRQKYLLDVYATRNICEIRV